MWSVWRRIMEHRTRLAVHRIGLPPEVDMANRRYRVGLEVIDGSGWCIRANGDTLRRYLLSNGNGGNGHTCLQKCKYTNREQTCRNSCSNTGSLVKGICPFYQSSLYGEQYRMLYTPSPLDRQSIIAINQSQSMRCITIAIPRCRQDIHQPSHGPIPSLLPKRHHLR